MLLRRLAPLVFFVCFFICASLWAQSSSAPAQNGDSQAQAGQPQTAQPQTAQPQTAQPPQAPPESDKKPAPDQTAPIAPADSTKLEPIKIQKAVYPVEAREKQLQGQVWVKLSVSESGDVAGVEVISGDTVLAGAAVDAAKKWKFKPFIKNGKPIAVTTKIPFDFAFSNTVSDTKVIEPALQQNPTSGPAPVADQAPNQAGAPTPQRVRVSQGVSTGLLLHKVNPVYPEQARRAGIQGTVVLQAEITTEGRIANLQVISGPDELVPAAIGAVQQWRYRPYLFRGNPVAVETTVQVNFTLSRR
jgi:TonB family protein